VTWQKTILYLLGAIALIVLGWFINDAFEDKPKTEIKEKIIIDTLYAERNFEKSKIAGKPKKVEAITDSGTVRTYKDTLEVNEAEGFFLKVTHTTVDSNNSIDSYWDYSYKAVEKIVKEYVTKDSIRTIVDTKYLTKPFFMNEWFYISVVGFILTIIAIIF